MPNCQELYDRVKKHPDAIVNDVGEKHPVIISETDAVFTLTDGSKVSKTIYFTFEYVKKHLQELKRCDCEGYQSAVAAYRVNKKAMRGGKPEEIVPSYWTRVYEN